VDAAIVSIISRELKPLYPKNASIIAFRRALYGITDSFRAERRAWTLEATVDDIREAARALRQSAMDYSAVAVVSGQELFIRESSVSERLKVEPIKLPV